MGVRPAAGTRVWEAGGRAPRSTLVTGGAFTSVSPVLGARRLLGEGGAPAPGHAQREMVEAEVSRTARGTPRTPGA